MHQFSQGTLLRIALSSINCALLHFCTLVYKYVKSVMNPLGDLKEEFEAGLGLGLTWRTSGCTLNAVAQSGCNLASAAVDCFNVAAEERNILTSGC